MMNCTESDIKRLQDNLQIIRRAGGWTAEEFGEMIGVTKQTISNLENSRTPMTKTQYIAIRTVLDYEIQNNPENAVLDTIITLLLDDSEADQADLEKAKSAALYASSAKKTGLDRDTIVSVISALLGTAIAVASVAGSSGNWISRIIKKG